MSEPTYQHHGATICSACHLEAWKRSKRKMRAGQP